MLPAAWRHPPTAHTISRRGPGQQPQAITGELTIPIPAGPRTGTSPAADGYGLWGSEIRFGVSCGQSGGDVVFVSRWRGLFPTDPGLVAVLRVTVAVLVVTVVLWVL